VGWGLNNESTLSSMSNLRSWLLKRATKDKISYWKCSVAWLWYRFWYVNGEQNEWIMLVKNIWSIIRLYRAVEDFSVYSNVITLHKQKSIKDPELTGNAVSLEEFRRKKEWNPVNSCI